MNAALDLSLLDSFGYPDPLAVMPDQFTPPPIRESPEKNLMRAVLEELIGSIGRHAYFAEVSPQHRSYLEKDLTWLRDEDDTYLYSFLHICAVLKLDPDWIREGILATLPKAISQRPKPNSLRKYGFRGVGNFKVNGSYKGHGLRKATSSGGEGIS